MQAENFGSSQRRVKAALGSSCSRLKTGKKSQEPAVRYQRPWLAGWKHSQMGTWSSGQGSIPDLGL